MRLMASPARRDELAQIHSEREAVIASRTPRTTMALTWHRCRRTRTSHFFERIERINARIIREVTLP